MSTKLVRAILERRLTDWAAARVPELRIAYENKPFTPTAGETYLRVHLLPALTQSEDLLGTHRGYLGVFQVAVVRPINVGPGGSLDIAAEIDTQFPVNGRYTSGAVTAQVITPAAAAPAYQTENEYIVPVSFQYRADTI